MNKKALMKISPYICGVMAGLTFSQPILTVSATVIPIEEVVKTKYSDEIKVLFEEMEQILIELESVEDIYEAGKTEEYLERLQELLPKFLVFNEIDEENKFLIGRKEGDILDVLFGRTVNILYEIPMKQGHELIKDFAKDLRDTYFETRYIAYADLLKTLIYNNPDSQLNALFSEYLDQLHVFATLGPDQEYNPDSIPEINAPSVMLPEFDLKEELDKESDKKWEEYYKENNVDITASTSTGSSTPNKNNIYYPPAPSNKTTYNVSYNVVGDKCVKSREKLVNGKSKGVETEIIPDNIAYEYCPTDKFFYLYEGFNKDNEEAISATEGIEVITYEYNGESAKQVRFSLKEDKISYNELVGILDIIVKEKEGEIATDSDKILYTFDGKPLIVREYEGSKTIDEVNKLIEKYVPLKFSINEAEEE